MQKLLSLALIGAVLSAPSAYADYYITGTLGQTTPSEDWLKSDTGFRFAFGLPINENFSVEFGYGKLGSFDVSSEFEEDVQDQTEYLLGTQLPGSDITINNLSLDTSLTTIELAVISRLPVSESVNLFGRFAMVRWDFKFDTKVTATSNGVTESFKDSSGSLSGTDFAFGVGAEMRFTEALNGQVELSQYQLEDLDIRLLGLGLKYSF